MQPPKRFDFLKLHFIILLWGFTAVLGKLIDLPSLEIVLIRSGITSALLALYLKRRLVLPAKLAIQLIGTGTLIGIHWVLFFAATKIASVSICMVGMATISLWTALLEPLLIRDRQVRWRDIALGMLIIAAVYVIYQGDAFRSDPNLGFGLLSAVCSAFVAAVFSIFNGPFAKKAHHHVVVAYEMAGAAMFCALSIVVLMNVNAAEAALFRSPAISDWAWLAILILACTIYAYGEYIELLKRLTVFTINFANNLEPVYGIVLGALIFHDHELVDASFYAGASVIAFAVILQPWIDKPHTEPQIS